MQRGEKLVKAKLFFIMISFFCVFLLCCGLLLTGGGAGGVGLNFVVDVPIIYTYYVLTSTLVAIFFVVVGLCFVVWYDRYRGTRKRQEFIGFGTSNNNLPTYLGFTFFSFCVFCGSSIYFQFTLLCFAITSIHSFFFSFSSHPFIEPNQLWPSPFFFPVIFFLFQHFCLLSFCFESLCFLPSFALFEHKMFVLF